MNIKPDVATERAVLAGITKYGKNCLAEIEEILDDDSFAEMSNKVIYKCLVHCLQDSQIIDYPSLLSSANDIGLYKAISTREQTEYIKSLFAFPIKEDNVVKHAVKLKKTQIRRELQSRVELVYQELAEMDSSETVGNILSSVENCIFDYTANLNNADDTKPVKIFDDVYDEIKHRADNPVEIVGIPTGYSLYDRTIGGGQRPGAVNLIVARTGVGKTMHAKSVCMHVAKMDIPVLMIDSEMNKMDQVNRAIADGTETQIDDVETGKFGKTTKRDKVFNFIRENENIPYYHKSTPLMSFDDLAAMIRRWILVEVGFDEDGNRNPCMIVYDYFKVMSQKDSEGRKEFELLGHQMSYIAQVCNKYGASCLSYVQANRDGIADEDLSIIAQSDRLSWFASSVCLLKEKTAEEIQADTAMGIFGNAKFIILKSRFGPKYLRDYIDMNRQGEYSRLSELGLASELKNRFSDDLEVEDAEN